MAEEVMKNSMENDPNQAANPLDNISGELKNIQGILISGYGKLPEACYLMLSIEDVEIARDWLSGLLTRLTYAEKPASTTAINFGLTARGVKMLTGNLDSFSSEFIDGMTSINRQRILADHGLSSPKNWTWGNAESEVDAVLMLYAQKDKLSQLLKHEMGRLEGVKVVVHLPTNQLSDGKEHFGFRDGITNPEIKSGPRKSEKPDDSIMPGEFLLGYQNEYGRTSGQQHSQDMSNILINGSYMVFRQIQQLVPEFWKYCDQQANGEEQKRDEIAAKMIGRWRSGAPLQDPPDSKKARNDFEYAKEDADGMHCPHAAHIRKAFPRDMLTFDPATAESSEVPVDVILDSIKISRRHRLLRRGRPYGKSASEELEPSELLADTGNEERGLYFIAFNANISRQFEFVQQTWLNNPKFPNQFDSPDPIAHGVNQQEGQDSPWTFAIPQEGYRLRLKNLPRFTVIRGGAYFFVPGRQGLEILAGIPTASDS
jgi:Dyp-type peroxidase family